MCLFGYENGLVKLKNLSQAERDTLYDTMKVFPGHCSRFNTMLDMLKCVVVEEVDDDSTIASTHFRNHDHERERDAYTTQHYKTNLVSNHIANANGNTNTNITKRPKTNQSTKTNRIYFGKDTNRD